MSEQNPQPFNTPDVFYDTPLPSNPINEWVVAELPEQTRSHIEHYENLSSSYATKASITLREATDYEDVGEIVSILNTVFQPEGGTYYPPGLVRNLLVAGALMLIADDPQSGQPVACALSIPSWKKTEPMLQTGPMAVLPQWQRKGIGLALKYAQACTALDAGVRYLSWSFDPASPHKAKMHLEKLPTVVSGYIPGVHIRPEMLIPDYPDDRLQVLWDLYKLAPTPLPDHEWVNIEQRSIKNLQYYFLPENPSPFCFTLPAELEELKQADPILALHHYRRMRIVFTAVVENGWRAYYHNGKYYVDTRP